MNKYKKKQVGHTVNMLFSIAGILICVFLSQIKLTNGVDVGSAYYILLASGLIVLLIGNFGFSVKKLIELKAIKHKFL